MRPNTLLGIWFGLVGLTSVVPAAPFTAGNLVVYRVGDGTANLVNTGNPVFLDEYTTNGVLVQSIVMPTNAGPGVNPLIASGTATSEGLLTRSVDGRYLVFMGYAANLGGTSVLANTASTVVPRAVGIVDYTGAVDTSTALTNFASGNNPRSAATTDGTNIWVGGAGSTVSAPGGVAFTVRGSSSATIISTNPVSNVRQVAIFANQLYASSGTTAPLRVGTVGTGLPVSGPVPTTNLPGFPTSSISPYAFVLVSLGGGAQPDTLYVADDNPGSGIIKYSYVDGVWVSNGLIAANGIRGLTACVSVSPSATNVYLYGTTGGSTTTGGGSIFAAVDSAGFNAPPSVGTATVIATAAVRTAFRGIAFAPEPPATPPLERPRIVAVTVTGSDVNLSWMVAGGTTNYVEAAGTLESGLEPGTFTDISGPIFVPGPETVTTNYTDAGALTNSPARYYRIRVVK